MGPNFGREAYVISADIIWTITGNTAGEAGVVCGIAHSDYSSTEISEWFLASSFDPGDKLLQEKSRRQCREAGVFPGIVGFSLNDGKHIRTKLKFPVEEGKTLDAFVINNSGATLTTGSTVIFSGKVYLRWT